MRKITLKGKIRRLFFNNRHDSAFFFENFLDKAKRPAARNLGQGKRFQTNIYAQNPVSITIQDCLDAVHKHST